MGRKPKAHKKARRLLAESSYGEEEQPGRSEGEGGREYEESYSGEWGEGYPDGYGLWEEKPVPFPGEVSTPPDIAEKTARLYSTGYQLANRYEGHWKRGRRHGKGTSTLRGPCPGGEGLVAGEYRGEWCHGMMHGKGSWRAEQGGTIVGWFERGAPHGEATFKGQGVVAEGPKRGEGFSHSYQGQWRNGAPEGRGRWESNEGGITQSYQGHWEAGRRHGEGHAVEEFAGEYEGEWRHGAREGHGVYNSSEGEIKYDGEWAEDRPHGHGRYQEWKHGEFEWYEGEWAQGMPHGHGMCGEGRRGTQFEGDWVQGKPKDLTVNPTFRAITPHRIFGTLAIPEPGVGQTSSENSVLFM